MATLSRFKAAHSLSAAPGVPSIRSRSGTAAVEELVLPVFALPLLVLLVLGVLVLGAPCTAGGETRAAVDWRPHTASSSTAALHMRMPTAQPVSCRGGRHRQNERRLRAGRCPKVRGDGRLLRTWRLASPRPHGPPCARPPSLSGCDPPRGRPSSSGHSALLITTNSPDDNPTCACGALS